MSPYERFWDKVVVNKRTGCWLWSAGYFRGGYGKFRYKGQFWMAHRFAYAMYRGDIPAGLVMDHLCRVKGCVNPWHLEAVTNQENILRGDGVAAKNAKKTRCPQGHEYAGDNVYVVPSGRRYCKTCHPSWPNHVYTGVALRRNPI